MSTNTKAHKNQTLTLSSLKKGVQEIIEIPVGDEKVQVLIYSNGEKHDFVYFNMHDNENTAVEATKKVIDEYGGKLFELHHRGAREIRFNLNGKNYQCDPNRIFTEVGVESTLRNYGNYSEEAKAEVVNFGKKLIDLILKDGKLVIAMHNNFNLKTFSAYTFQKGSAFGNDASEVYINPNRGAGDFFYVTETKNYDFFKNHNFNVVLQDNLAVTNDGSLSVYCSSNGISYINIEAVHGHLEEQVEMLKLLQELIQK